MTNTIEKPCLSTFHPFKKKTFTWREGDENMNWCSSCYHHWKVSKMLMNSVVIKRETLYGFREIELTREEVHALVDELFDEIDN